MKRINLIYALTAVILGLALAFASAVPAAHAAKAAPAQPAAASPTPEEHPQIHDALVALRQAKAHLQSAKHDYGGHRSDALRATEEAIHQLEICLKYDK
jgi:hypothetical protein